MSQPPEAKPHPFNNTKPSSRPGASKQGRNKKLKKQYEQIIFRDWCKACGICSAFCPKKVIGRNEDGLPTLERPDDCIGCRFCELHCPDFAITIKERNGNRERALS